MQQTGSHIVRMGGPDTPLKPLVPAIQVGDGNREVMKLLGSLVFSQISNKGEIVRLTHQCLSGLLCAPGSRSKGPGDNKNACPRCQAHEAERTGNHKINGDIRSRRFVYVLSPYHRGCAQKADEDCYDDPYNDPLS